MKFCHVGSALRASPFRRVSALRASALRSIAFSANALHAAAIFRALLDLRHGVSHAPRNDSDHAECGRVYYTTLSIVETGTSSGRGHAYRISIFWTGKFEFRLTSNISAADQDTAKKIFLQKLTIEFYAWLISSSATVRRSAARGPKRKTFPPKFLKNGEADRNHSGSVNRARSAEENPGILVSYFLGGGGGMPPTLTKNFVKSAPPIFVKMCTTTQLPNGFPTVKKN